MLVISFATMLWMSLHTSSKPDGIDIIMKAIFGMMFALDVVQDDNGMYFGSSEECIELFMRMLEPYGSTSIIC